MKYTTTISILLTIAICILYFSHQRKTLRSHQVVSHTQTSTAQKPVKLPMTQGSLPEPPAENRDKRVNPLPTPTTSEVSLNSEQDQENPAFQVDDSTTEEPIYDEETGNLAWDIWLEEKEEFYRSELGLDDKTLERIQEISLSAGNRVQEIVKQLEATPERITEPKWQEMINQIDKNEEAEVSNLIGTDRVQKVLSFRTTFNEDIYTRFGIRMKVMSF